MLEHQEMTREHNLHAETLINQRAIDLFSKPLSDKERLWEWLKGQEFVKTSAIISWGVRNYSNRSDRNARQLAQEGKLVRLSDNEKVLRFGNCKEDIYKVVI